MTFVVEGLTVTYLPEGTEGLGELHVSAATKTFSGTAVGYVDDAALLDWTTALRAYPWSKDARMRVSFALGEQETLGLTAFVVTERGQLAVEVHLADVDTDSHSPTFGAVHEARLLVLTTYEAVQRFAENLAEAVTGAGGSAHLDVEELA